MTRRRVLVVVSGLAVLLVSASVLQIERGKGNVAMTVVFNRDPRATLPQEKAVVRILERDPKVKNLVFIGASGSSLMRTLPLPLPLKPPANPSPDSLRMATTRVYVSQLASRIRPLPGVESVKTD